MIRHAGLVALRVDGRWTGALIEGASGAGKSDLALRAMQAGLRLVADDRVVVWACDGGLYGRAPETLRDLIEVRGLDVVRETSLAFARIAVLVRCDAAPGQGERILNGQVVELCGVPLPVVDMWPFEPSAVVKLRRSICHIGHVRQGAYQACLVPHTLP